MNNDIVYLLSYLDPFLPIDDRSTFSSNNLDVLILSRQGEFEMDNDIILNMKVYCDHSIDKRLCILSGIDWEIVCEFLLDKRKHEIQSFPKTKLSSLYENEIIQIYDVDMNNFKISRIENQENFERDLVYLKISDSGKKEIFNNNPHRFL